MGNEQIPDAELNVMTCLWRLGPATARQIREVLGKRRPMAHSTICTLLSRLESRGLVTRQKSGEGKAYLYRAAVKPAKTHRRMLGDLLDRVFGGSGVALVTSLFDTHPPTEDEIDQLQNLLNELRVEESKNIKRKGERQ